MPVFRCNDHIIGFCGADAELIHRHRLNRLAVRADHGHFQAGNAHIKKRHGRSINKAQADFFVRLKHACPILFRRFAIDQEGIAGDIGQIRFQHAHLIPHFAVSPCRFQPIPLDLFPHIAQGFTLILIVLCRNFQIFLNLIAALLMKIRQHHHIITLSFFMRRQRLFPFRINHQSAVQAILLLPFRMRVIPISTALTHLEFINKFFIWPNAVETVKAWHAIHDAWQQQAMPMDGRVFIFQMILDPDHRIIAFFKL